MSDTIVVVLVVLTGATFLVCLIALVKVSGRDSSGLEAVFREELRTFRDELKLSREETAASSRSLREEVMRAQRDANEVLVKTISALGEAQHTRLGEVVSALNRQVETNREDQEKARNTLERKFLEIQQSNEAKLDEMRRTVDEKLSSTLEKRLGESFRLVGDRLEAVQRGLGEMKGLADGVGDLKRVLTNVKDRGTWGEFQLAAILEQVLTPDQYGANVKIGGNEIVEFAVKLPGRDDHADPVWIPIDSKFPKEDYERLLEASERADPAGVKAATAALSAALRKSAKEIQSKYVKPPFTTDFGVMFLPTEGLYSEVLRQPGMVDELQTSCRVLVAGPTTLSAILNSLRVGFKTLAIEKRSHEVWTVLSAVKTEFGKFGSILERLRKQLDTASKTIDETQTKTRTIERRLRGVEELPAAKSEEILGLSEVSGEPSDPPLAIENQGFSAKIEKERHDH